MVSVAGWRDCAEGERYFPGSLLPCPALEYEDGRTFCGLVRHPARHLGIPFEEANAYLGPLFSQIIGIGQGCSCPDEAEDEA